MQTRSPTQTNISPNSSFTPARSGLLQRKCNCGNSANLTGKCSKCESDRLTLQRKAKNNNESSEIPPIVHEVLNSLGQPLGSEVQSFMESRFERNHHIQRQAISSINPSKLTLGEPHSPREKEADRVTDIVMNSAVQTPAPPSLLAHDPQEYDFSSVRIHTGIKAAESAQALYAQAYTVGQNIVFASGHYQPETKAGQKLLAHELAHVMQQGVTTQVIQRKDNKKPKSQSKPTTNSKLVFNEIKKRNPDLAELITPRSINSSNPAEPPAIKSGPPQNGEEHLWKVRVTAIQGFRGSQIVTGGEQRKKAKGITQVTHFLDITWALPLNPDPEFLKQSISEDEAFTLTAAEPLYHELLHARIIMERDPHWTKQHTQVFKGFTDIMQIAASQAVDKERQALKKQIGVMAAGGGLKGTAIIDAEDRFYEFLVHEKYDADTQAKPFGKTYSNAFIAQRYGEVVARSLNADEPSLRGEKEKLVKAAEKLFDKLDQVGQANPINPPPTSQP